MTLTAEGQSPPVAWLLLRDARSLLRSDEYRRAVLDAGTAAELALTAMLDKRATATEDLEVARRVKKTTMLGPLLALATELLPSRAPDNMKQRLVLPRNAATHEAQDPSEEDAAEAITATEELLNISFPLSDFGLVAR